MHGSIIMDRMMGGGMLLMVLLGITAMATLVAVTIFLIRRSK